MAAADSFAIEISSRRAELQPFLCKQTLPDCPYKWTVLGFPLQQNIAQDAPELASPLNLRWSGRPSSEQRDVLAVVSDLAGRELKRQASKSSRANTLVKGFYILPHYQNITTLVLRLFYCRVPSKGTHRFTQPDDVDAAPFQNYLIHFFKIDAPAPSPAQLRKESTAIDRVLTQTFNVSLLHIRAETSKSALSAANNNNTTATAARSQTRALVPRQREVTSSEPDLFPSVSSISPHQGNKGDAVVFLDSCSDKGKTNRRMSTHFVQKLLGHSPQSEAILDDDEEEEQEESEEEEEDDDNDVPSSPPQPTWSELDEEGEVACNPDDRDGQRRLLQAKRAAALRTICPCLDCINTQNPSRPTESEEDDFEESEPQDESWMDNSFAQPDTEHSCTSPPDEAPFEKHHTKSLVVGKPDAAEDRQVAKHAGPSTTTAGDPSTGATGPAPIPVEGDRMTDLIRVRNYFWRDPYDYSEELRTRVTDANFGRTDHDMAIGYLQKRVSILRDQAQNYRNYNANSVEQGDMFSKRRYELMVEADALELKILDMQYDKMTQIRREARPSRKLENEDVYPNKRQRLT